MKKTISIVLATILLSLSFGIFASAAGRRVDVRVNDKTVAADVPTQLIGNTTYVPIYKFCSAVSQAKRAMTARRKQRRLPVAA